MKRTMKNVTLSITMLTLAYVPMASAAAHRGPKVRSELAANEDRIQHELMDQLINFIAETRVLHLPKRSGSGDMELIPSHDLLSAPYEEQAKIIYDLPQELRESIFNKLAEQLMRGPKKSPKGPFKQISDTKQISQLDTFFLLSAILCDDREQKYAALRESILDCLGETNLYTLKTKLGVSHVQQLLPADFKREFLTCDPIKMGQLIIRLNPLMQVK